MKDKFLIIITNCMLIYAMLANFVLVMSIVLSLIITISILGLLFGNGDENNFSNLLKEETFSELSDIISIFLSLFIFFVVYFYNVFDKLI